MLLSTIREIVVQSAQKYGDGDAIRYKIKKDTIESKSFKDLQADSESFSRVLASLDALGSHVAVTGMTSYPWLVTYFGTVNSGSVCVPLDVSLPADEMCELIDRSDASVLVIDEIRKDVMLTAKAKCPKCKKKSETGKRFLSGSFWRNIKARFPMSRNRRILRRSCLLPEPQERVKALC